MDDANIPSLLSLPYLGFVEPNDPLYLNTRARLLSPSNPWFFKVQCCLRVSQDNFRRAAQRKALVGLMWAPT